MILVPPEILEKYGAKLTGYEKDTVIFSEGTVAYNYYQVSNGLVKMTNYGDGSDFIQGLFAEGESFGEPALFGDFPYPASAISVSPVKLWVLRKHHFIDLLKDHFDIFYQLTRILSLRLQYKSFMLKTITCEDPDERIISVLDYFKHKMTKHASSGKMFANPLPLTRQQIADLTGLRVETVIRKIKHMETKGNFKIIKRKIYFVS